MPDTSHVHRSPVTLPLSVPLLANLRLPRLLTARTPDYFAALDRRTVALTHTLATLLAQRGFAHGGIND